MQEVQRFVFEEKNVRVVMRDDSPWFVAVDVCKVLQIKNSRQLLENLDTDERADVSITYGSQSRKVNIISEPGLYSVIIRSKSPVAAPFRRWVTHDVLPSIRRTGVYSGFAAAGALPAINQLSEQWVRCMNARIRWDLRLLMERHRLTSADLVRFAQEAASVPGTIAGFDWHRWDVAAPQPSDYELFMRIKPDFKATIVELVDRNSSAK